MLGGRIIRPAGKKRSCSTKMENIQRYLQIARVKAPVYAKESYYFIKAQRHIMINITVALITVLIWQLYCFSRRSHTDVAGKLMTIGIDPCCAYPCRHGGICTTLPDGFECDCHRTGYYGRTCHKPTIYTWFQTLFCPSKDFILLFSGRFPNFWKWMKWHPSMTWLLKKFSFLSQCTVIYLPVLYNKVHDYTTLDVFYNRTLYNRILGPIPRNCPRPMGIHDGTLLYGTLGKHNPLRVNHNGKLSMKKIDGEEFPTVSAHNDYLFRSMGLATTGADGKPQKALSSIAGPLFVLTTLWAREHNRVCDLLRAKHVGWDDNRLYETARLIVIGTLTQIAYSEMLKHMNQDYVTIKYQPEMTHLTNIQHYNVYLQEFMRVYEWHMQMPDAMVIDGSQIYIFEDSNLNMTLVFKYGLNQFLEAMFNTRAGKITTQNNAGILEGVRKEMLQESRDLRLQSFNNYRRFLSLKPYKHFHEFSDEPSIVQTLRDLYEHVDAVEFYPGLYADKDFISITPQTMRMIYNTWYMKWFMSSPLHFFSWWKPATFGGKEFMRTIIKTTLKDFICRNMYGNCKSLHISFTVPLKKKGAQKRRH